MNRILLSWLGNTNLKAIEHAEAVGVGPIAQALDSGRFARAELLCDQSADETAAYLAWLRLRTDAEIVSQQ